MAEGTIRTIREDRGFGFIRPDGERDDIFFHADVVQGAPFDQLREGERVEFEAGPDPHSPSRRRAERVRLLD